VPSAPEALAQPRHGGNLRDEFQRRCAPLIARYVRGDTDRQHLVDTLEAMAPDGLTTEDLQAIIECADAEKADGADALQTFAAACASADQKQKQNDTPIELPSPAAPMPCARRILALRYTVAAQLTLRYWRGDFYVWATTHWRALSPEDMKIILWRLTEHATYVNADGACRPWTPNIDKITNLERALAAACAIPTTCEPPLFLDDAEHGVTIAVANGLLDLTARSSRTVRRFSILPRSPSPLIRMHGGPPSSTSSSPRNGPGSQPSSRCWRNGSATSFPAVPISRKSC
jgi:hypothetical protein